MAAIIESIIKTDPVGKWYIEIIDTNEEDKKEICLDVDEYATKIEEMGKEYGPDVEIVWSQEENVTDIQVHEIRMQMMAYEQRIEEEKNSQTSNDHNEDGTPKF
jgi:hypothetical protein